MKIILVDDGKISKLLGNFFELKMLFLVIDELLKVKIDKKFKYWNIININIIWRFVIVNRILLLFIFFFVILWGDIKVGMVKV